MSRLPRIAVGTVQSESTHSVVLWALIDLMERNGTHVQSFLSQSRLLRQEGTSLLTRQSQRHRHLDSWLMTPEICREIFRHGADTCDLAIVEGRYAVNESNGPSGSLDPLCEWLDLPRVVVLDAACASDCRFPQRPEKVDAVLLDRVADADQLARLQIMMEAVWGVPVLGYLGELPAIRAKINRLSEGSQPSVEICRSLGDQLAPRLKQDSFLKLAARNPSLNQPTWLFRNASLPQLLRVAVAYDDAFNGYFPDALDLMEIQGATILDFSPLRDESLPDAVDIVYLGCGHPERHAELLARNHCMRMSLRQFIHGGGRVYAEGAGLAYLCQYLENANGRTATMTGAISAIAKHRPKPTLTRPVELTFSRDNWLGTSSSSLRGYLDESWDIEPTGPFDSLAAEPNHARDLIGTRNVIGSRVHLNFAAHPRFLQSFFHPLSSPAKASMARQNGARFRSIELP